MVDPRKTLLATEMLDMVVNRGTEIVPILLGIYEDIWYDEFQEDIPESLILLLKKKYEARRSLCTIQSIFQGQS